MKCKKKEPLIPFYEVEKRKKSGAGK